MSLEEALNVALKAARVYENAMTDLEAAFEGLENVPVSDAEDKAFAEVLGEEKTSSVLVAELRVLSTLFPLDGEVLVDRLQTLSDACLATEWEDNE